MRKDERMKDEPENSRSCSSFILVPNGKDFAMARIVRAVAALLLVIVGLGIAGCIHTWTQTYQDYPPSAYGPPHQPQATPAMGESLVVASSVAVASHRRDRQRSVTAVTRSGRSPPSPTAVGCQLRE